MVSRRWALFAVVVALLAYSCYLLGQWQFHRLHDRKATNAQTRQNIRAAPAPVGDVLAVGRPAREGDEWRRVRATGTYLPHRSVIVRYQTGDAASAVDLATPLRTGSGPPLLADRGWMQTGNNVGTGTVTPPPPPAGPVTVVGWVRVDATGDAARVVDRSTRAISSAEMAGPFPLRVFGGLVDPKREPPPAAKPLATAELPDL